MVRYRAFCAERCVADPLLGGWSATESSTFMSLYVAELGRLKRCIATNVQGVRLEFLARGADVSVFSDERVSIIRAAATEEVKPREARQKASEAATILGADWKLIEEVGRVLGHRPVEWSAAEMDAMMTCLGVQWGFQFFGRIGEVAHTRVHKLDRIEQVAARLAAGSGSSKGAQRPTAYTATAVRCLDVLFHVVHAGTDEMVVYTAGAAPTPVSRSEVRKMSTVLRLHKTGHAQTLTQRYEVLDPEGGVREAVTTGGRARLRNLLEDLYDFADWSGARGSDLFFSRHAIVFRGKHQQKRVSSYKVLTAAMVSSALKDGAERLGRSRKHYATHSLKKGAVQTMQAKTDATPMELASMAHHKNVASVHHYVEVNAHGLGPLAHVDRETRHEIVDMGPIRLDHAVEYHAPSGMAADGSPPKAGAAALQRALPMPVGQRP